MFSVEVGHCREQEEDELSVVADVNLCDEDYLQRSEHSTARHRKNHALGMVTQNMWVSVFLLAALKQ